MNYSTEVQLVLEHEVLFLFSGLIPTRCSKIVLKNEVPIHNLSLGVRAAILSLTCNNAEHSSLKPEKIFTNDGACDES